MTNRERAEKLATELWSRVALRPGTFTKLVDEIERALDEVETEARADERAECANIARPWSKEAYYEILSRR